METKRNLKYFTTRGINILLIIGVAISIAGLLMMFIIPLGNGYNFGFIVLMVGAAVAVFGSGAKSAEADIDNEIYGKIKDMPEQAQIKYEVYEKNFLKILNPVFLKGFSFEGENVHCKKGPDHKFRTDTYNAAQLYFTQEKIYVYGKHLSLLDGSEEANYEFGGVYPFQDVDKAYIEDKTVKLIGRDISVHSFGLRLKDGTDVFKFNVEYGADVDKAADDINHAIEKMTERAIERAADKAAKRAALREFDEKNAKAAAADAQ